MIKKSTPHIDELTDSRSVVHAKTLGCPCRKSPPLEARTAWLQQHGQLRKKATAIGWRRSWQCLSCLRDMGGDGKNAGPPTLELPEFIKYDHPTRVEITARRLAAYEESVAQLPSKRSAWFKDHDLYLKTAQWAALRKAALERDKSCCVRCGGLATQIHHLTYDRWQQEELSDLESLCRGCHEKEHAE